MEITKINGEEIKIGKTSIIVKGDNSKTIGVIRSCTIINNSLAPRILFEISRKLAEINKVKEQDELANSCVRSGIIQIVKCRY